MAQVRGKRRGKQRESFEGRDCRLSGLTPNSDEADDQNDSGCGNEKRRRKVEEARKDQKLNLSMAR